MAFVHGMAIMLAVHGTARALDNKWFVVAFQIGIVFQRGNTLAMMLLLRAGGNRGQEQSM
jgi:hypothetical protein